MPALPAATASTADAATSLRHCTPLASAVTLGETMDDWHRRVAGQLVAHTRGRSQTDGESTLEVAFGRVRAAVAYVLEYARAHRVAVAGNVAGDDVWVQIGTGARARYTLNRKDGVVVVRLAGQDGRVVRWDTALGTLADGTGAGDLEAIARAALDDLLTDWAAHPTTEEPRAATGRDYDDEPTKG